MAGQLAGWTKLSQEQREEELEQARRFWGDDDSWSRLTEAAQIFAALTRPMVRLIPDRVLDTVKCLNCADSGFQPGRAYGVWFCAICDRGLHLEVGYWRRLRFPEVRGRRVASSEGMREFEAYAIRKPHRAERIKQAIAEAVERERLQAHEVRE